MASAEDHIAAFHAAMAQRGIAVKGMPIGDGNLHRFDVEGDRKGSKSGYYTLHLDGHPAGVFGCWSRSYHDEDKAWADLELEWRKARDEKLAKAGEP